MMKILVVGGTGLIGAHITRELLTQGHKVTIGTRGKGENDFGDNVQRLVINRIDSDNLLQALNGLEFDIVYDTQAYSSNEVKYLLEAVSCKKYIEISTVSVYWPEIKNSLIEEDFNPYEYPLKWCDRSDFAYDEIKRQAECAIFQAYTKIPSIAVRIPFVIGTDDTTRRFHFYVEQILNRKAIHLDNLESEISFIKSAEAGKFMAWLADKDLQGPVNASSIGQISISEIITHIENKAGIKAILSAEADGAPYNGCPTFSLNLQKATTAGFEFSSLNEWIFELIDELIESTK